MNAGKATTTKTTFSRETAVKIDINADRSTVWNLLTNAGDIPRWNSTIISIEGNIKEGETIKLVSTLDESRTFSLKVKEFQPNSKLVWGDFQGTRIYQLTQNGATTTFSMNEKIGGILFPLFSRMIPPFDESFEQFAADLKNEAERAHNS